MRAVAAAVALVCFAAGAAAADPCVRPWADGDCSGYPITEADVSLALVDASLDRRAQASTSAGWMFRLDPRWAVGPIASIGYESELGYSAGLGARLRRTVTPSTAVDLTGAARLVAADRAESGAGASVEAAIVGADWIGVAARIETVRIADRWATSVHGTVRVGSYLGLAVGGTSALLVLLLQNVAFTS